MSPTPRIDDDIAALLDGCARRFQLLAEQEEGPYRRGEQPRRRVIVEDRSGAPLRVGLRLRSAGSAPAAGAEVEIWHCDAEGRYSGYPPNEPGVAVDPLPQAASYAPEETFLRGRQATDARGDVEFVSIYPGWYPGRAVHVHLVVRVDELRYTSQLYFPEAVTADVYSRHPYRPHGLPDTSHATDGIFATGGEPAVLDIRAAAEGYVGVACLVLPDQEET